MNQNETQLAEKIVREIALMVIQGEANVRQTMLQKYGEFGFEITEEYLKNEQQLETKERKVKIGQSYFTKEGKLVKCLESNDLYDNWFWFDDGFSRRIDGYYCSDEDLAVSIWDIDWDKPVN